MVNIGSMPVFAKTYDSHSCTTNPPIPTSQLAKDNINTTLDTTSLNSKLFAGMDHEHKSKIEGIRIRTPRYLFRAWGRYSGGDSRLNTPERITPKAFLSNNGHNSPYDMTYAQFKSMALAHLRTERGSFVTEFSSWSQSLSFVLGFFSAAEYISVMDTKELKEVNPAYYVPLLPIFPIGTLPYAHEYLVHGIVQGPFHRAIPLRAFKDMGLGTGSVFDWHLGSGENIALTADLVRRCRSIGEQYGDTFALALTLALVSKSVSRDITKSGEDVKVLLRGLRGLKVSGLWLDDRSIMESIVYVEGWPDVRRFIRLMRYLVVLCTVAREEGDDKGQHLEGRRTPGFAEELDEKPVEKPIEQILRPAARERRGRKPSARCTPPVTRAVTRREELRELKRFGRLVSGLRIDMNRRGKKANNGENEDIGEVEMANTLRAINISD